MKNSKYRILGVIPARGGSTRIKNKNIKKLNNEPLISYTIKESLKSLFLTAICVTSDSDKILDFSKKLGIKFLIKRNKTLSSNFIPSYPSIKDALIRMEKINKIKYDFIVMLQPTSPFRLSNDIDSCLSKLIKSKKFDSAVSIVDVEGSHPLRMKCIKKGSLVNYLNFEGENMKPRQQLPKVYIRNGAIYAIKRQEFIEMKSLVGKIVMPFIMSKNKSINIDDEIDFALANIFIKKLKN